MVKLFGEFFRLGCGIRSNRKERLVFISTRAMVPRVPSGILIDVLEIERNYRHPF